MSALPHSRRSSRRRGRRRARAGGGGGFARLISAGRACCQCRRCGACALAAAALILQPCPRHPSPPCAQAAMYKTKSDANSSRVAGMEKDVRLTNERARDMHGATGLMCSQKIGF